MSKTTIVKSIYDTTKNITDIKNVNVSSDKTLVDHGNKNILAVQVGNTVGGS